MVSLFDIRIKIDDDFIIIERNEKIFDDNKNIIINELKNNIIFDADDESDNDKFENFFFLKTDRSAYGRKLTIIRIASYSIISKKMRKTIQIIISSTKITILIVFRIILTVSIINITSVSKKLKRLFENISPFILYTVQSRGGRIYL
jgi:hypothetical protein